MTLIVLQVVLPYAVFSIDVEKGTVTDAAPIARWMVGKRVEEVTLWVSRKGGEIVVLGGATPKWEKVWTLYVVTNTGVCGGKPMFVWTPYEEGREAFEDAAARALRAAARLAAAGR